MRRLLILSFGFAAAFAAPTSAQMCGGGQMAGQQAQPAASAGMCGGGAASVPAAGQQAQTPNAGGCSCCQRMAMMQAPMGGQGMMGGQGAGGQGTAGQPNKDSMPNMQMPAPDSSGAPPAEMPNR